MSSSDGRFFPFKDPSYPGKSLEDKVLEEARRRVLLIATIILKKKGGKNAREPAFRHQAGTGFLKSVQPKI
jgi:hypothetical protein